MRPQIGDVITRKEGTLLPLPAIPPSLEDLDCLVPSSFLLMPANGLPEHPVATLPKHQADLLYIQYFTAVDPLAHVLHKPSFDRHYSVLWGQVLQRKPPSKVASALVLSVLFSAAMSLPIHTVPVQFGTDKQALISRLKLCASGPACARHILTVHRYGTCALPSQCHPDVQHRNHAGPGHISGTASTVVPAAWSLTTAGPPVPRRSIPRPFFHSWHAHPTSNICRVAPGRCQPRL